MPSAWAQTAVALLTGGKKAFPDNFIEKKKGKEKSIEAQV